MPSSVIKLDRNRIKRDIAEQYREVVVPILEARLREILEPLYNSTIQYWGSTPPDPETGRKENNTPVPEFRLRVTQKPSGNPLNGFRVELFSNMTDGSDNTHPLWNVLDIGTVFPNGTPAIRRRNQYRTRAGLADQPFTGFADGYFRFQAGDRFPANNYTEQINVALIAAWNFTDFKLKTDVEKFPTPVGAI